MPLEFMLLNPLSRSASRRLRSLLFVFRAIARLYPQPAVGWAVAENSRGTQRHRQHPQDPDDGSTHRFRNDGIDKNCGNGAPDDTIGFSHIVFHGMHSLLSRNLLDAVTRRWGDAGVLLLPVSPCPRVSVSGGYCFTLSASPTVYPTSLSALVIASRSVVVSSKRTVTVWLGISVLTSSTPLTASTALRALAAVLPQTTPGTGRT